MKRGGAGFQKRKERGARERGEREKLTQIRPVSLTQFQPSIPATSSAELGTNLKLVRCRSHPLCHRHWKLTGTPPFEARKATAQSFFVAVDPARFLATPPPGSCSSTHTHHFLTDHRGRRLGCKRPLGNSWILELRSTAVAAHGRSPPAPLDSPRSELLDQSFLSSLTEVQSPLTGRGNAVIS